MITLWSITLRATRYEALMALRHKVLWLCLTPLGVLAMSLTLVAPTVVSQHDPVARMGTAILAVNLIYTVGIGVALTDRLPQQHRAGLADLLAATPSGPTTYMAAALLGPLGIALVPVTVLLVLLGVGLSISHNSLAPVGAAIIGVGAVIVPAALLTAALATLLGLILPQVLARIIVIGLWFWSTAFSPSLFSGVPTPTDTLLSPLGGYLAAAVLHVNPSWANGGAPGTLRPIANGASAITNVALLFAVTLFFFGAARVVAARRA